MRNAIHLVNVATYQSECPKPTFRVRSTTSAHQHHLTDAEIASRPRKYCGATWATIASKTARTIFASTRRSPSAVIYWGPL